MDLRKFVSILFVVVFFSPGWAHALGLNDVSVLLPLPTSLEDTNLISPDTQGAAGRLISANAQRLIEKQISGIEQLRVVALRLDPCFAVLQEAAPEQCRAQIRFIWQPLYQVNEKIWARDHAVHTFYEISQQELEALLVDLQKIKKSSAVVDDPGPLTVHPTIAKEGLSGPYWSSLRADLLKLVGEKRMSRITLMTGSSPYWMFQGFDVVRGELKPIEIAQANGPQENISNFAPKGDDFLGGIAQALNGSDNLSELLQNSKSLENSSVAKRQAIADTIFRIENPRLNSANTMDCAHCHLASPATHWLQQHGAGLNFESNAFRFQSPWNLYRNGDLEAANLNFRNFGYFNRSAAISQRVVNETAFVVELLNRRLTSPAL
jgi:hypothetical protein